MIESFSGQGNERKIVHINMITDKVFAIKLVLDEGVFNVVSADAPQTGIERIKKQFCEEMDGLMQNILEGERIVIGGDLNDHVGKNNIGYENVHNGFGFGDRNLMEDSIFGFAAAYNLAIANTYFKKRDDHFIIFKSRSDLYK